MAFKIFISHAEADRDLADDLRARLKQALGDVSLVNPRSRPGQNWSAAILAGLEEADEILVLLTANSLASQHVQVEVGAGLALRKPVVPIVVGLDAAALPGWVKQLPFVKYPALNPFLQELARQASGRAAPARAGVT